MRASMIVLWLVVPEGFALGENAARYRNGDGPAPSRFLGSILG